MKKLSAEHLAKAFDLRHVVRDVSLEVAPYEVVGLLGPNGAGKTTSFYMIVGLVPMDQGHVFLDGQDLSRRPMHERSKLGLSYLPQEPSIFRKLTVEENILAILELQKNQSTQDRKDRLEALISEFHLEKIRKQPGLALSGGERRRVEIARVLAQNPRYILLDEPFAGIDPISVLEIKNLIVQLQKKGLGILITDHNVRETLKICDRAYIVYDGHVLFHGTPEDILKHPEVRSSYLGEDYVTSTEAL